MTYSWHGTMSSLLCIFNVYCKTTAQWSKEKKKGGPALQTMSGLILKNEQNLSPCAWGTVWTVLPFLGQGVGNQLGYYSSHLFSRVTHVCLEATKILHSTKQRKGVALWLFLSLLRLFFPPDFFNCMPLCNDNHRNFQLGKHLKEWLIPLPLNQTT